MPTVHLNITAGATREQKEQIVADFTQSLVTHLGKHPEHIHIIITEVAEENWGYAGILTDDWKKQSLRETPSSESNCFLINSDRPGKLG